MHDLSQVLLATCDRGPQIGTCPDLRWRHPKSPSKPSPPSATSPLRNGTPAPIPKLIRTASIISTRWLQAPRQAAPAPIPDWPITPLFLMHFLQLRKLRDRPAPA